ncbi:S8 family serine peptidase [Nonomuraea sp. K271]|uniref:S8 family serine peptidase n=1 Tax=Nonomuraea sp. K271 TaxID=1848319 RepID=UPI00191C1B9F
MALPVSAGAQPAGAEAPGLYVVQFAGAPLATYSGGVAGIPATKPTGHSKLDTTSRRSRLYQEHLRAERTEALRKAGVPTSKVVSDYSVTFNGLAARLGSAEVRRLRSTAGVARVYKDRVHTWHTSSTPRFLGMSGPDGVWRSHLGGQDRAGEGMIIGVIDGGFWPENPSFAALPEPRPDADAIAAKWSGECVTGEHEPVTCNNKVIGARWYNQSGYGDPANGEFLSPRDRAGHGSHTASTAAGVPVDASVAGAPVGQVSGMAPAARLAIYKAVWHVAPGVGAGGTTDLLKAIDDAVADGVDVINFSIGDGYDEFDPTDVAFFNAAAAGVFVATAAGNSGPGAGTLDNAQAWVTTVAAGTHDVRYTKAVTLGDGATYEGVGLGGALPAERLVDAATAPAPEVDAARAALCHVGSLDPDKVRGKVVLCRRGENARVEKSQAVEEAGGLGMIMYNNTPAESLNTEYHSVPTVHVDSAAGAAIKGYAAGNHDATAALSAMAQASQRAPGVASFSSVGPSATSRGDLLKPDVLAPGVDIVAAVPPVSNPANSSYGLKSGTSMASPHVAGTAALLMQKNPAWSPSAVKSAIMTTAYQAGKEDKPIIRLSDGARAAPFDMGAGHVRPAGMFDPGLVYESHEVDWHRYSCGLGVDMRLDDGSSACAAHGAMDPSNLNYPSIAIGDFVGRQTVTRTVTDTTGRDSVYTVKVEAPPGITVNVSPTELTVPAGGSASFQVKVTAATPIMNRYAFGSLTWSDRAGHRVRSPIAVKPMMVRHPAAITGSGSAGSQALQVTPGYSGTLKAAPLGLTAPSVTTSRLVGTYNGGFDPRNPPSSPAIAKKTITTAAGTRLVRIATYDEYPDGTDIDVYVVRDGAFLGASQGLTSEEEVLLPGSGTFDVYVLQWGLPAGTDATDVRLYSYALTQATGNLSVAPAEAQARPGDPVTVTVNWTGVPSGSHYFGAVEYFSGTTSLGMTALKVEG